MIKINSKWQPLIDIFLDWNKKINLSAIRDTQGVYVKHVLDSLEVNNIIDFIADMNVIDVGTGGGFPLLPLAITNPATSFVGIDARKKKIAAVQTMIETLHITNAKAIRTRAEDHQQSYDIVMGRAVAYIDKFLDRTLPLCKQGGIFVLFKQHKEAEKKDLLQLCKKKNLTLRTEHHYTLFDGDIPRVIYVLQK